MIHEKTQKRYIVKTVPLERAGRELSILKALNGNGYPYLLGYEIVNGVMEIKMAEVEGTCLGETKLDAYNWIEIFKSLVRKIEYLHQQNILHRDISPNNIIIDSCLEPHLIDFGSAAFLTGISEETEIVGTLKYAAPEAVFNPKGYRESSDYYALAKVFLEKLTPYYNHLPPTFLECLSKCTQIIPERRCKNGAELLMLL